MNSNINKLLTLGAVAMIVITVFGVFAADDIDGTEGSVVSPNKDPIKVDCVEIKDDGSWNTSRLVWDNCPNVLYDLVDDVPTVTFKNANIEFTLSTEPSATQFGLKNNNTFKEGKMKIILVGENTISAKCDGEVGVMSLNKLEIVGQSMRDSLTVKVHSETSSDKENITLDCMITTKATIEKCTLNFILEKENEQTPPTDPSRTFCGLSYNDGAVCRNARLLFSIGDVNNDYNFNGISCENALAVFTLENSVIRTNGLNHIDNNSSFLGFVYNQVTFDCCKIDVDLPAGKVFEDLSGNGKVTFKDFNSITFYEAGGKKTVIDKSQSPYDLSGTPIKLIVKSNVNEPVDYDDTLAITVTIAVSVFLAVLVLFIVLLRHR